MLKSLQDPVKSLHIAINCYLNSFIILNITNNLFYMWNSPSEPFLIENLYRKLRIFSRVFQSHFYIFNFLLCQSFSKSLLFSKSKLCI